MFCIRFSYLFVFLTSNSFKLESNKGQEFMVEEANEKKYYGSVQVLYKHVFPNFGPPTTPKTGKITMASDPQLTKCLCNT